MILDWQAAGIALLFAVDVALLARRFKRRGNWLITSALMPRLYLALLYIAIASGSLALEDRVGYVRLGLMFLLLVEVLNHVVNWRNDHP